MKQMATVRTKHKCVSIRQEQHPSEPAPAVLWVYEFQAVLATSVENEGFFANFPGGSISQNSNTELDWQVHQEKYVDVIDPE